MGEISNIATTDTSHTTHIAYWIQPVLFKRRWLNFKAFKNSSIYTRQTLYTCTNVFNHNALRYYAPL